MDDLYGESVETKFVPTYIDMLIGSLFSRPACRLNGILSYMPIEKMKRLLEDTHSMAEIRWRSVQTPLDVGTNFDRANFRKLLDLYHSLAKRPPINLATSIERRTTMPHSTKKTSQKSIVLADLFQNIDQIMRVIPFTRGADGTMAPVGYDDSFEKYASFAIEDGSSIGSMSDEAIGAWAHGFIPTIVQYKIGDRVREGHNAMYIVFTMTFPINDIWRVRARVSISCYDPRRDLNALVQTHAALSADRYTSMEDVDKMLSSLSSRGIDRYNIDLVYKGDSLYKHLEEVLLPFISISRVREIFFSTSHFRLAWSLIGPILEKTDRPRFVKINDSILRGDMSPMSPHYIEATIPTLDSIYKTLADDASLISRPIYKGGEETKLIFTGDGLVFDAFSIHEAIERVERPTGLNVFDAILFKGTYYIYRALIVDGVEYFSRTEMESESVLRSMKISSNKIKIMSSDELNDENFWPMIGKIFAPQSELIGITLVDRAATYFQKEVSRYRVRMPKEIHLDFLLKRVNKDFVSSKKIPAGRVYIAYTTMNRRSIQSMPIRQMKTGLWRSKHFSIKRTQPLTAVEFMTTVMDNSFIVIDPSTTSIDEFDNAIVECAFIDGWFRPIKVNEAKTTAYRGGLPIYGMRYNDALKLLPPILGQEVSYPSLYVADLANAIALHPTYVDTIIALESMKAVIYGNYANHRHVTKTLIELGCGNGDDILRLYHAGMRTIFHVSRDIEAMIEYSRRTKTFLSTYGVGRRQSYNPVVYPANPPIIHDEPVFSIRSIIESSTSDGILKVGSAILDDASKIISLDPDYRLIGADVVMMNLSLDRMVDGPFNLYRARLFCDKLLGCGGRIVIVCFDKSQIDKAFTEVGWVHDKNPSIVRLVHTGLQRCGEDKYIIEKKEKGFRLTTEMSDPIDYYFVDSKKVIEAFESVTTDENRVKHSYSCIEDHLVIEDESFLDTFSKASGKKCSLIEAIRQEDHRFLSLFRIIVLEKNGTKRQLSLMQILEMS